MITICDPVHEKVPNVTLYMKRYQMVKQKNAQKRVKTHVL